MFCRRWSTATPTAPRSASARGELVTDPDDRPHLRRACCPVSRRSAIAICGTRVGSIADRIASNDAAASGERRAISSPRSASPAPTTSPSTWPAPTSAWSRCRCSTTRRPPSSGRSSPRRSRRCSRSARNTWISPSSRRWTARRCGACWSSTTAPAVDDQRDNVERAQARLRDAGMSVTVATARRDRRAWPRTAAEPGTPAAATTGWR